jgi:two-component system, response regulator PdtaR
MTSSRVLIVEDNPIIAHDLADELESRGIMALQFAASLRDALREIGRLMPDVAIIDLNLRDGRTGGQLARALVRSGVKVCVLSGQDHPDHSLMEVNHTFIAKPAPASVVAEIVRAYLDARPPAACAPAAPAPVHAASVLAISVSSGVASESLNMRHITVPPPMLQ